MGHRLRDLQMREAGHDGGRVLFSHIDQRTLQGAQQLDGGRSISRSHKRASVATESLRRRPVHYRPGIAAIGRDSMFMCVFQIDARH